MKSDPKRLKKKKNLFLGYLESKIRIQILNLESIQKIKWKNNLLKQKLLF